MQIQKKQEYEGHSWISLVDLSQGYKKPVISSGGLCPASGSLKDHRDGKSVEGKIGDDSKTKFTVAMCLPIRAEKGDKFKDVKDKYDAIVKKLEKLKQDKTILYNSNSNNCSMWATGFMNDNGFPGFIPEKSMFAEADVRCITPYTVSQEILLSCLKYKNNINKITEVHASCIDLLKK